MNKKGQAGAAAVIIFCIVLFLGIIIAAIGFDGVDASHTGVMVRLGKITGYMESGYKWTGMLTHVYSYDMRIRKATIEMKGDFNAPDKKGQPTYAQIDVNYRLKQDPNVVIDLYRNVGKDDAIVNTLNIEPIILEGYKQATVKYDALEMLDKRQELKELAVENIRRNFPTQYFEIESIVISNIRYSEQFQKALDDKQTAIQLAQKAKNDLETVKFEQQQVVEKLKAEAEGYKLQSEQITPLLVQKSWIEKWNGQLPTYVLTTQDQANYLMQLPTITGTAGGQ